MRYPQLVIHDSDGWLARQLADLASESRWLVREPKSSEATLALVRDPRPSVAFIRVEPQDEAIDSFALIAELHRACPDAAVVAVSDTKLPDADRIAWTGVLFDLGAAFVLFPPLSKSVLEDVASGLMASAIKRVMGDGPTRKDEVIDLADEAHS